MATSSSILAWRIPMNREAWWATVHEIASEGERVMALESREGTRASRRVEEGLSRSPPGFSVHGDSPGKNTGVGCHACLQGIFPTQGLNPGLPHCRRILYQLSLEFPRETGLILRCPLPPPSSGASSVSISPMKPRLEAFTRKGPLFLPPGHRRLASTVAFSGCARLS